MTDCMTSTQRNIYRLAAKGLNIKKCSGTESKTINIFKLQWWKQIFYDKGQKKVNAHETCQLLAASQNTKIALLSLKFILQVHLIKQYKPMWALLNWCATGFLWFSLSQ